MIFPQSSKRISKLEPMGAEEINDVQERTNKGTDVGGAYTHADAWAIGVDSLCRSDGSAVDEHGHLLPGMHVGTDDGTAFIPMSRIAMRDTNGKIPASMLPSYIDDMVFGSMVFDDANNRAVFTEKYYDPHTGTTQIRKYISPYPAAPQPDEYPPAENLIYNDTLSDGSHTATNIQYRYIESQAGSTKPYGFIEVPGSRVIATKYGMTVNMDLDYPNVQINAKKPKCYIGSGSNTFTINDTNVGLGTMVSTYFNEISLVSDTTKFTVQNLCTADELLPEANKKVVYHVDIDLACYPTNKTANIIKISLKSGNNTVVSCDYDMSSNASSNDMDSVSVSFDFTADSSTTSREFYFLGEQNNPVTAKVTRMSVTELL